MHFKISNNFNFIRILGFACSLLLFCAGNCVAGDSIGVVKKPLGYNYYRGDTLLNFTGISKIVSNDIEANKKIRQAKMLADIGGTIEIIGLGVSIYGVGKSVYEGDFNSGYVFTGTGIFFAGLIPFAILANSKTHSAVFLYNANTKPRTGNVSPTYGIGILLGFR